MIEHIFKNPLTRAKIRRFLRVKRASFSLLLLVILYGISLFSELIANDLPLYVRVNGKSYFPVLKFYPEDVFLKNGKRTRADYKALAKSDLFLKTTKNIIVFPPIPFGPYESIDSDEIPTAKNVRMKITRMPEAGYIYLSRDLVLQNDLFLLEKGSRRNQKGKRITDIFELPEDFLSGIRVRFENRPALRAKVLAAKDGDAFVLRLSSFKPRSAPPQRIRLIYRQAGAREIVAEAEFEPGKRVEDSLIFGSPFFNSVKESDLESIFKRIKARFIRPVESYTFSANGIRYTAVFDKKDILFPHPPVKGHPFGIDSAGRDVLVRILYGLRISLTFGILLVALSMGLGVVAGAVQGYYGGATDLLGQRLTEVISAIPFLYVMILLGSVYGRSFALLLFCYALFNWIGISYYIRAEFLRLRRLPFVEAAVCMQVRPAKVILRHILPNALTPLITFFPFSLVGAIGALAALDYLGFGLPPPTPSWGELLFQAQQYRWAWWLILYPSLALFIVMMLGVFVGEGIRRAYDPKDYNRFE